SIASWPERCPDLGWRRRNRPPRKASSVVSVETSLIRAQFMRQSSICQDLARHAVVIFVNENPPWQDAERAFDDAHVLVQHQMMDIGGVEQRADRRNQHYIVGSNQFSQITTPITVTVPLRARCIPALAASRGSFYCLSPG